MRSSRHKYVRHCASDCLISHTKAGYHTHYMYPMKGEHRPFEFYYLKHCDVTFKLSPYYYVYVNEDGMIFPKRFKNRCGVRYEMYNMNHDY